MCFAGAVRGGADGGGNYADGNPLSVLPPIVGGPGALTVRRRLWYGVATGTAVPEARTGGMLVGTLSKRVNMRVDEETFEAYNKVATFFNRSIADFMREALQGGIPTMQTLGAMIDRAKAGDADAVQRLFDSMLAMHQGTMANAQERMAAELATGLGPTDER